MKVETYLTWEIRDKHGQLKSYEKKKANSYLRSFIDQLHLLMSNNPVTGGLINVSSSTYSGGATSTQDFSANSGVGITTWGIVVGTGTTAVAIGQYGLTTLILHGSTSGKLTYGETVFTDPATVGSTRSFTVQRTFTNNTASPITIEEVGIYTYGSSSLSICIERTLSTKTINNGSTGTATYTIGVTV